MTSQAHIAPWAEIVPGVGPLTTDDLLTLPDDSWQYEVVDGLLVGGTTGVVRAGSATVRGLQNGFLRYYAALLLVGVAGVSLYFLISSS